jgi:sugar phosphate isomerase/epimerase
VVNHFHVHDVFGVLSERESAELGYGDLHLPPGWGEIPFDDLFANTAFPRSPVFMIELVRGRKTRLLSHLEDMLAECRRLAGLMPEAS